MHDKFNHHTNSPPFGKQKTTYQDYNPYHSTTNMDDEYWEEVYHAEPFYSRHGRIGRLRYLAYSIVLTAICYVLIAPIAIAMVLLEPVMGEMVAIFLLLIIPIAFYAGFVPTVRRLNDLNRSGWFSLLMLIPYLNVLFGLYLIFAPGDEGENDYGAPAEPPSLRVKIVAFLMPVIAILGILAAIILPAYQDYVLRSQGF